MSNENKDLQEQMRAESMHQMCKQHMYYHVTIKTREGQEVEGIITDLDKKNVYIMVPQNMMPAEEVEQESPQMSQQQIGQQAQQAQQTQQSGQRYQRQSYGRPYYRRFYRQIYPLAALAALSLYPYYPPYPYPYYPYYPPYPYPYPYY
ncbi:hypothetical protein QUF49_16650 [Fictibacillus sp. b24]|uniref:hypothetical protein n=1 Tax=Fictibacillus sp. b24 TaxID=3055863 RepID=UPI0025A09DAB|nr:hypothetical protein [Fictibacillus sp. b24]MDM5317641.1 hypothetical protein [Fictibacillus sp. b24]